MQAALRGLRRKALRASRSGDSSGFLVSINVQPGDGHAVDTTTESNAKNAREAAYSRQVRKRDDDEDDEE